MLLTVFYQVINLLQTCAAQTVVMGLFKKPPGILADRNSGTLTTINISNLAFKIFAAPGTVFQFMLFQPCTYYFYIFLLDADDQAFSTLVLNPGRRRKELHHCNPISPIVIISAKETSPKIYQAFTPTCCLNSLAAFTISKSAALVSFQPLVFKPQSGLTQS